MWPISVKRPKHKQHILEKNLLQFWVNTIQEKSNIYLFEYAMIFFHEEKNKKKTDPTELTWSNYKDRF